MKAATNDYELSGAAARSTTVTVPLTQPYGVGAIAPARKFQPALLVLLGAYAAMAVTMIGLAMMHHYFIGGTESDFLLSYQPEAGRFLSGQPLQLDLHPPLYPIVVALMETAVHDWLTAAKIISTVAGLATAGLAIGLFYRLAGYGAAAGVLLGFAHSSSFLAYSALGSTDVFFLMLCYAAFYAALDYWIRPRGSAALLCGIGIGAALLTRENGLTMLLLLLMPLLTPNAGMRVKGLIIVAAGIALPILLWCAWAWRTHSAFYVSTVHVNLAMTYFSRGPDRRSLDAYLDIASRFQSLWQVITHDPVRMGGIYLRDLLFLPGRLVFRLQTPVIGVLGLLGLAALVRGGRKGFTALFFAAIGSQVLLVNFKAFEARYYFFLLPIWGAAAGLYLERLARRLYSRDPVKAFSWGFVALFTGGLAVNAVLAYPSLHPPFESELRNATAALRSVVPPGSEIYARKPHLPFYLQGDFRLLPNAQNLDQLRDELSVPRNRKAFLYFGSYEAHLRSGLRNLASAEDAPPWLTPIAHGQSEAGPWYLYELGTENTLR